MGLHAQTAKAVAARLAHLHQAAQRLDADGNTARFLGALDAGKDRSAGLSGRPARAPNGQRRQPRSSTSWRTWRSRWKLAAAQLFLPPVAARLDGAQDARPGSTTSTTCWRWSRSALRGPAASASRRAARAATGWPIIDEFQDTDDVQWEIFRTVFHDSGGRNAALRRRRSQAGDLRLPRRRRRRPTPRRATPSRAADAPTVDARPQLPLDARRHRRLRTPSSTPTAAEPFFDRARTCVRRPSLPGRADDAAPPAPGDHAPGRRDRATAPSVASLPMRQVREALTQAIAAEIERLLRRGPDAPRADEIFVLTRDAGRGRGRRARCATRAASRTSSTTRRASTATAEARRCAISSRAVDEPRDPARRLRGLADAVLRPRAGAIFRRAARRRRAATPLDERLLAWRAARRARATGAPLFERILDDSGVARARAALGRRARGASRTYRHLFEVLVARATRARPASLGDLVGASAALIAAGRRPMPEEGERPAPRERARRRPDHDHPQGQGPRGRPRLSLRRVRAVHGPGGAQDLRRRGSDRRLFAREAAAPTPSKRARRGDASEDQRLLYVALTRARRAPLPAVRRRPTSVERDGRMRRGLLAHHRRLPPRPPAPAHACVPTRAHADRVARSTTRRVDPRARRPDDDARAHRRRRTRLAARAGQTSRSTPRGRARRDAPPPAPASS